MARGAAAFIPPSNNRNPNVQHPLNLGITAWWVFHGQAAGANVTIRDVSGNRVDLSQWVTGSVYGPGSYEGGIYKFENTAGLTRTTSDEVYMDTTTCSIVVDTVHTTTNDDDVFINVQLVGTQLNFVMYHNGSGNTLNFSYRNDSAAQRNFTTPHTREAYKRYVYAVVSDSTGVSMYVNGVPGTVTGTHSGTPTGDGTGALRVGRSGNFAGGEHSGWINSMRFYRTRALSGGEVWQISQNPLIGFEGDTVPMEATGGQPTHLRYAPLHSGYIAGRGF